MEELTAASTETTTSTTSSPTPSRTLAPLKKSTGSTVFFCMVAGGCAALASVFAKLAVDGQWNFLHLFFCKLWLVNGSEVCHLASSGAGSSSGSPIEQDEGYVRFERFMWLLRCCCVLAIFAANAIMWTAFTRALQTARSSVQATVLNTATNFTLTVGRRRRVVVVDSLLGWWTHSGGGGGCCSPSHLNPLPPVSLSVAVNVSDHSLTTPPP